MSRAIVLLTVGALWIAPLLACTGKRPANLGLEDSRLAPCPSRPNCVSSDATDEKHAIAPFELAKPADEAWAAARESVAALPRTRIITERPDYLHAKSRSRVFQFADDLELQLRAAEGMIAVRSASRVGYGDFGVNRKRIEALRAALVASGAIHPSRAPSATPSPPE